jgi:hypothetical protein
LNAPPPALKKKGDLKKRIPVGFFILSFYVLSYHLGQLYQALFSIYLLAVIPVELLKVARNKSKDQATKMPWFEIALWFITLFFTLPYQVMNYRSLQLSGLTRHEYPLLHAILFEYHMHIMLALICIWFVAFVLNL